jgi:hypothetical protein
VVFLFYKLKPKKMKSKVLVPFVLVLFLGGSVIATGQDRNQKKIDRIQRKIEKQHQKLSELRGDEFNSYVVAPSFNAEKIEKIRQEAMAQAEVAREHAREAREMQREIMEEQREAMQGQREAMMEQKRDMERRMIVIGKDHAKNFQYKFKSPNWESNGGEAFVFDGNEFEFKMPEMKSGVYSIYSGNQDNLSINKNLTDETSSADFSYEVKEGAAGIAISVTGEIESGKVKVVIKRPDGEVYNEYTLSSLANVNWKQSINFEDQEESQYLGKWTVTVSAEKAKGTYRVDMWER